MFGCCDPLVLEKKKKIRENQSCRLLFLSSFALTNAMQEHVTEMEN